MAYHSKVENQIIQLKIVSCLINYKKVKTNRISSPNKKKNFLDDSCFISYFISNIITDGFINRISSPNRKITSIISLVFFIDDNCISPTKRPFVISLVIYV
jgi:hypothetical protein